MNNLTDALNLVSKTYFLLIAYFLHQFANLNFLISAFISQIMLRIFFIRCFLLYFLRTCLKKYFHNAFIKILSLFFVVTWCIQRVLTCIFEFSSQLDYFIKLYCIFLEKTFFLFEWIFLVFIKSFFEFFSI